MIKFITNNPICFIPEEKTLVISDVHIGIEHELFKSGIVVPKQSDSFLKTLNFAIDLTHAKRLVILGDLKYKVPGTSMGELKAIPIFLEKLMKNVKVILCKGNHDDNIETLLPDGVKLHGSGGFKMHNYGFFHGHAWPSKKLMSCDYLLMGHLQPAVEFKDSLGYRTIEQIWVKAKVDAKLTMKKYGISKTGKLNLIIVPAFNKLSGAFVLNSKNKRGLFGPLFNSKILNSKKFKLYMLDGTYLGSLEEFTKKQS